LGVSRREGFEYVEVIHAASARHRGFGIGDTTPIPRLFLFALLPCLLAAQAQPAPQRTPAQAAAAVRENYTKFDYRIPMRDGVRLFTSVYVARILSLTKPGMI